MTVFEYDANKSQHNLTKHGIDFIEAQKLWNDPNLIEIPARTQDEPRLLIVGKQEASRLGVTPQSIIQTSLAEHLAVNKPI